MSTPQAPVGGSDPEQDKWLDDAAESVKKHAFYMKRSLDQGDIREALKYAALMCGELRTSNLSPKNYYTLYMDVTNELGELERFFEEEDKQQSGRSIVELYETVQHAGNIIPRLYLLTTVAAVYIRSKKAPAKDILFDLVELCRGVQHPMRGLFLRNYLSQISKDKLPDSGSEYEGVGGTVKDAIEFVLQNFGEMNKLWVRMQHQGAVRDRARREKERRNLRQLVGTNLVRLSELQGVDLAAYKEFVLPRVLEQIVNCKDALAQEYLMDIVIQVFPDEYHLQTLETFLATLSQLQKTVNVKNIIIALMNRLSSYARDQAEAAGAGVSTNSLLSSIDMFPLFLRYSQEAIEANTKMSLEDVLSLQVALINFASAVYPERLGYIDGVLQASVNALEKNAKSKLDSACVKLVTQLLTLPLDSLGLRILELANYAAVMNFLDYPTRKQVSMSIVEALLKLEQPVQLVEQADKLYAIIASLLKDQDDQRPAEDDAFEFDQEQTLVSRLLNLLRNPDTDVQFALYAIARRHYASDTGKRRLDTTLPPLVLASLALAQRVHVREEKKDENDAFTVKSKKVFGFVHEMVSTLAPHHAERALRLFLQAAQCADSAGFEAIAYEFVAQALTVYEDEISDSKAQFQAVTLVTATLAQLRSLGDENYDTLITKATQHSAKLLKKEHACQAVFNCAHLFWAGPDSAPGHRDDRRVLECLQRSLKIANLCVGSQVHLFVEILNKYLYFYERGCPSITTRYLKGLVALIDEHLPNLDNSELSQQAQHHYQNTIAHIKLRQSQDDALGEKYRAISAPETGTDA